MDMHDYALQLLRFNFWLIVYLTSRGQAKKSKEPFWNDKFGLCLISFTNSNQKELMSHATDAQID